MRGLAVEGGGRRPLFVVVVVDGVPPAVAVVGVDTGVSSFKFNRILSSLPSLFTSLPPLPGAGLSLLPLPPTGGGGVFLPVGLSMRDDDEA